MQNPADNDSTQNVHRRGGDHPFIDTENRADTIGVTLSGMTLYFVNEHDHRIDALILFGPPLDSLSFRLDLK